MDELDTEASPRGETFLRFLEAIEHFLKFCREIKLQVKDRPNVKQIDLLVFEPSCCNVRLIIMF